MRTYVQPSGQHKKLLNLCLPGPWILKQKPYSLARITMFPKEIVLFGVESSLYTEKLLTGGRVKNYLRADGRTDRQTDMVLNGRSLSKGHATY